MQSPINAFYPQINRPDFSNVHINHAKKKLPLGINDVRIATGT